MLLRNRNIHGISETAVHLDGIRDFYVNFFNKQNLMRFTFV